MLLMAASPREPCGFAGWLLEANKQTLYVLILCGVSVTCDVVESIASMVIVAFGCHFPLFHLQCPRLVFL